MNKIGSYTIIEEVFTSHETIVFRAEAKSSKTVILKTIRESALNNHNLAIFNSEFKINTLFDSDFIARPIEFISHDNLPVIVSEDIEAISLKEFIAKKPEYFSENYDLGLQLAISIAKGIAEIHDKNIIHKDINPSNIVYNLNRNQVNIIDFGLSSELTFENFDSLDINHLEGSLAYISPEQTGRINRNIDYRTDYYSFGITLYELFSGRLPFNASSVREWVHCQIAREALPLHMINSDIPKSLSLIVTKLMEKNVEKRYQSPYGIIQDLTLCFQEFEKGEEIVGFIPGKNDISRNFRVSQKLYGRDPEIALMHSALDDLHSYSSLFIAVKGNPGSGKSSLVGELYKTIILKDGYFISGKFEQFKRDIPYWAFKSAFSKLFERIITEEETSHKKWKERINLALENNANVITELIPALEMIIGTQAPPQKLPSFEERARFIVTFQKLVNVFASTNHPLVLFIDDLQWADQASLDLLTTLLKPEKNKAFLCIGAYRDNELAIGHPLFEKLEVVKKVCGRAIEVETKGLSSDVIIELLKDSLHCSKDSVKELANSCYTKTLGNPFFLNAFLSDLYRIGSLFYNTEKGIWDWDIEEIKKTSVTNNVVDLLCDRIQGLSEDTQNALKFASCLGSEFSIEALSIISEKNRKELVFLLKGALSKSLIHPLNENYRFAEFEDNPDIHYRFFHDRVLQATYSLIDDAEKEVIHYKIANLLLESYSEAEIEENIFELIEHFNQAIHLLSENNRLLLSKLNLIAAQKAKKSSAFHQAYNYLNIGLNVIKDDCWSIEYAHTLKLHSVMAEIAFLAGNREVMHEVIEKVFRKAKTAIDKAEAFEAYLFALSFDHEYLKAIKEGRKFLAELHVSIPEKVRIGNILTLLVKTGLLVKRYKPEKLLELPQISDPAAKAALRIMGMLITPSYYANPLLFPILAFKFVILTLKYGLSPISPLGFITYGMIINTSLKKIVVGYKYGQLGIKMLDKVNSRRYWANTSCIYHATLCFWMEPIKSSTDGFMEDYEAALETGNIEYATTSVAICISYLIFEGENLEKLFTKYNDLEIFLQQWPQQPNTNLLKAFIQTVLHLQNKKEHPEVLIGEKVDEEFMIKEALQVKDFSQLASLFVNKLMLAYLFENYEAALLIVVKLEKWIKNITNLLQYPMFLFYRSLLHLAIYQEYSISRKVLAMRKIKKARNKLRSWAKHTPANFTNKYLLIEAEIARVNGNFKESIEKYNQAIALSVEKKNNFDEALSMELFAKFWKQLSNANLAEFYFEKAALVYNLWGAKAKSDHLMQNHSTSSSIKDSLSSSKMKGNLKSLSSAETVSLDIETLMDAANTISGEVVFTELIKKIITIMIQHAGAQKGLLLLKDKINGELVINAIGNVKQAKQDIVLCNEICTEKNVPLSLIRLAVNKKETVIVADAVHDNDFSKDSYVKENRLKSVLAMPIIQLSEILGVIFLENNLATNVFTPHHLAVLNMLSSQVGISLENAFLYENLELKVAERTEQIKIQAEKLLTANTKLIELDHFKTGMTGMIVHDLKNPLHTILSSSDDPEILFAGNKMLNMVLNILDIQKFESAQVKIEPVTFSLKSSSLEALRQLKLLYEKKSIVIENNLPENATVKGDFDLITRVFINLLSNAIKFSTNNAKISIYYEDSQNTGYCQVKIIDRGLGIPDDQLSSIFDKFYQVEPKKLGSVRSTGLGLAYCKLAIEAHGGKISVKSKLNHGSTFSFFLPKGTSAEKDMILPEKKPINIFYELSEKDKTYLSSFREAFKKFSVYEFSDVSKLLESIEDKNETVSSWKDELETVVRACNEERYTAMINQL